MLRSQRRKHEVAIQQAQAAQAAQQAARAAPTRRRAEACVVSTLAEPGAGLVTVVEDLPVGAADAALTQLICDILLDDGCATAPASVPAVGSETSAACVAPLQMSAASAAPDTGDAGARCYLHMEVEELRNQMRAMERREGLQPELLQLREPERPTDRIIAPTPQHVAAAPPHQSHAEVQNPTHPLAAPPLAAPPPPPPPPPPQEPPPPLPTRPPADAPSSQEKVEPPSTGSGARASGRLTRSRDEERAWDRVEMMERDREQLLQGLEAAKTLGKEIASALADKLAAVASQPRERRRRPVTGARPTQTAATPPRPPPVRPQPVVGHSAEQSAPSGARPPAELQETSHARDEEPAHVGDSVLTMLSEGEVSEGEVPTVAGGDGGSLSAPSRTHGAESDDAQLADGTAMSDGEVSRGAPRHR